jgi:light-regulated signal transduction histidine kinase (bacteriophytochrome)
MSGSWTDGAGAGLSPGDASPSLEVDAGRAERAWQAATQKAILNILEDSSEERSRQGTIHRALINILEDFGAEKDRLEETQRAILNILEDFEDEKRKVEAVNAELRREVADRTAAERALRDKSEALARSNAELEQFAYVASHDLQEPLRMVSSYVQLFEKRYAGQVDAKAQRYIEYAVEGAKRMQALIGGLLEFSRVGRIDEPVGPVDMGAALDQALLDLRSAIEESRAVVTRGPLPTVTGNAARIAQVLQNLIGNAVKYRRPDVSPAINVSATAAEREWVFAVEDNGIGIDQQYLERIFIIFQRLHTRTEYPGTGIGLSICKKVVEHHGGRMWAVSKPGEGTTFYFTLPRDA